jgi:transposase-like protein
MGYRGKVKEQEAARALRAEGHTLADIAQKLGVSKSSVSLWVRGVPFTPSPRRYGPQRRRQPLRERRLREVEQLNRQGKTRIGKLSDEAFFIAGLALYAGEGAKGDGLVKFSNSDPEMVRFFCAWFRRFFAVDESRLRCSVYLHQGLDLGSTEAFWSELTRIPKAQFGKAYRAVPDPSISAEQARTRLLLRQLLLFAHAPRNNGLGSRPAIFVMLFRGSSIRQSNALLTRWLRVRVPPPELKPRQGRERSCPWTRSPRGRNRPRWRRPAVGARPPT